MPRGIPLKELKTAINRTLRIKKGMLHSIKLRNISESKKVDEFTRKRAEKKRERVEKMIEQNMKDAGVGDVMLKRRDRTLLGRKKEAILKKNLIVMKNTLVLTQRNILKKVVVLKLNVS